MQKEFGINLPKRSNHAGIVFIRDFLIIIFIKKCKQNHKVIFDYLFKSSYMPV